jgi:hypothetical protein
MRQAFDGALSPTPHHYEVMGRAAEIARTLGSPAAGAEHLFLGMLHDGGWPVTVVSELVDLGQAEAAVIEILNRPDYSPPAPHRFPASPGYAHPWGAEVAFAMGDSYIGLEHAFLSMIRKRDTVPARALAGLADLGALEATVIEAKNAAASGPPENAVFLPEGRELDAPLRRAIVKALPENTTYGFNRSADHRTWISVITADAAVDPALTREVLDTALAALSEEETRDRSG